MPANFTIVARAITVTAASDTKVYDSTTSSSAIPTVTTGSLAGTDTATFTQTFDTKNVGTGKTLTPTGTVSDGNGGANYTDHLRQRHHRCHHRPRAHRHATTDTKTYDDTTSSARSRPSPSGTLAGTDTGSFTQTFDTKNVGTGKTLTPAGTVSDGNGGGELRHHLRQRHHRRHHRPRRHRLRDDRHQDLRRHHQLGGDPDHHVGTLVGTDTGSFTQTFDTATVGTGKTLTPAGTITDGNTGANYTITFVNDTTGVISQWAVTVTADSGQAKIYGTPDPTLTYTVTSGSLQPGDSFTGALARTAGENVGTTAINQGTLTAGPNYTITFVPANFTIVARAITVTAVTTPRSTTARSPRQVCPTITTGTLAGTDTATFTQTFDTKNVGTAKTLTPAGTVTDGNGGNNYAVTFATNTTGVITAASVTALPTAANKVYDGTTAAVVSGGTLTGVIAPDVVTLNVAGATGVFTPDANVGNGKTVNVTGLALSGAQAGNYQLTSTSATTTANITTATTTIAIGTHSPNPSNVGQAYTVTWSISVTAPGAGTPTGTVTVTDGLNTCNAAVGAGQCTLTSTTGGAKTLTATYAGDANFTTSTSPGVSHTVTAAGGTPPTVDVTVNRAGTGAQTTAAFSTTGAGRWVFAFVRMDGPASANSQSSTVSGAGLTWSLVRRTNARFGTSDVWAVFAPTTLTNVTVTATPLVGGFRQAFTVIAFANSAGPGASASNSAATGAPTVSLTTTQANSLVYAAGNDWDRAVTHTVPANQTMVNQVLDPVGDTFWTQRLTNAVASPGAVTINNPAPTNDQWNYAAVEILSGTTVSLAPTSTGLARSAGPNPSIPGQSVSFTATVTSGSGTPSGTVQFKDGVTNLGAPVTLIAGQATFTTTTLSTGAHSITAVYSGDSSFATSTSGAVAHQVDQAATATALVRSAGPNPSTVGQLVSFTATVTSGSGTPSGTVQFRDGVTNLGAPIALVAGQATLPPPPSASAHTPSPPSTPVT